MFCKQCGEPINPNQAVCIKCGTKVGDGFSFCANCGSPVPPGAAVCLNCGFAIVNHQAGDLGDKRSRQEFSVFSSVASAFTTSI